MNDTDSKFSVVVGIDGSDTAIEAALWAIDEAVSRSVPLRLVCVTKAKHPSAEDYYADIHHAEDSLRAAQAAVDATGKSVKVETAVLTGLPGVSLVEESYDAALVCIGSVGIGRYARSILGSTATEVAEKAHCPVAIIRPSDTGADHSVNWIAVADTGSRDTGAVLEAAMDEGALRQAPVLVVGKHGSVERDVEALRSVIRGFASIRSGTAPISRGSSRTMTSACNSPSSAAPKPTRWPISSAPTDTTGSPIPGRRCWWSEAEASPGRRWFDDRGVAGHAGRCARLPGFRPVEW